MSDCPDCGGVTTRVRPTDRQAGLPVRLRAGDELAPLSGFVCEDCGRIRFTTNIDSGGGRGCSACGGPIAGGRLRSPEGELAVVDDETGRTTRLSATACADCGAVELRTDGLDGSGGGSCPVCDSGLRRSYPQLGEGETGRGVRFSVVGAEDAPDRTDPVAWSCTGCGLVLLYDRATGG